MRGVRGDPPESSESPAAFRANWRMRNGQSYAKLLLKKGQNTISKSPEREEEERTAERTEENRMN